MKKLITVLIVLGFYTNISAQVTFSEDPSNNRYQSVAFDFGSGLEFKKLFTEVNNQDYGIKVLGSIWLLKGSQVYFTINPGSSITTVTMYYAIYKAGTTPSFTAMDLPTNNSVPYGLYTYYEISKSINILKNVNSEGTWYMEFYWIADTVPGGLVYLNNSGSNYKLSFTADASLPVELTTFTAFAEENKVALAWETATEVNNYGFEIERALASSAFEKSWEKIGFVEGHGNSNSPKEYSFIDKTAENSGKYFYRLKQVDVDGQFKYSPEIEVTFVAPAKFELSQNYPNPFNPTTNIRFKLPEAGNVKLAVYNLLGQKVADLVNQNMETGFHNITFNGSNLTSGIYIYRLEAGNNVMIRKMQLVK